MDWDSLQEELIEKLLETSLSHGSWQKGCGKYF
jgi:hypothetical protein